VRPLLLALLTAGSALAQDASLRLGGKEVALSSAARARMGELARETFALCGSNTLQQPGIF